MSRRRLRRWLALLAAATGLAGPAAAGVVTRDFVPLSDGTRLYYTLTLPAAEGRYPVVLQYDPYDAGVASDPTWNNAGYAMLGVNFRGTGCSEGVFPVTRADVWGADGAEVVTWAAGQPWSTGAVGMIGYSFTGTSQLATAALSGPALKAIAPGNVFPDLYRDLVYPGGIHNGWIPLWLLAGRAYLVGADNLLQLLSDPRCIKGTLEQLLPNVAQSFDTQLHRYLDGYWRHQPESQLGRVQLPVLGCVNWQDTTVYSRATNMFRERLDPALTWLVGGNGAHTDCPISRARLIRFFDRYLKGEDNGWEATPRLLLIHELTGASGVRETLGDDAGAWQSAFATWSDMDGAISPVALYLHRDGQLDLTAPSGFEPPDDYFHPTPTANTPTDWTGALNFWTLPSLPGGSSRYTTPALASDAEFLGGGSADLWISSTASDTDLQITLSEVRPDGQETYVQNGWLRLSQRRLDPERSTTLRPWHTHREADVEPLTPGEPVLARIELLPFNHVFRAGSAIRLAVDAPGGWFQVLPLPAQNSVYHEPGRESRLVLGWLPRGTARAPMPACGSLLNQPCRPSTAAVPGGRFALDSSGVTTDSPATRARAGSGCSATGVPARDSLSAFALLLALSRLSSRGSSRRRSSGSRPASARGGARGR